MNTQPISKQEPLKSSSTSSAPQTALTKGAQRTTPAVPSVPLPPSDPLSKGSQKVPFVPNPQTAPTTEQLPVAIPTESLDPTSIEFFLVHQYNKEPDDAKRKILYSKILQQREANSTDEKVKEIVPEIETIKDTPILPTDAFKFQPEPEDYISLQTLINLEGVNPQVLEIVDNHEYYSANNFPYADRAVRIALDNEYRKFRQTGDLTSYRKIVSLLNVAQGSALQGDYSGVYDKLPEISPNLNPEQRARMNVLLEAFIREDDNREKHDAYYEEILAINQQANNPEPEKPINPNALEPPPVVQETDIQKQAKQKQKRFGLLAQSSYDTYYADTATANAKLQEYLPAHSIIEEDTTKNSTVIQRINNDGSRDIIISYRGTDPTNVLDLMADAQIFAGNPDFLLGSPVGRFKQAEDTYLRIKEKYPDANIMITGHSLGAKEGLLVAEKYNIPAELFNVGSSPIDFLIPNAEANPNITIYNVPSDFISVSNRYDTSQKVIDVPNKGNVFNPISPHSMDNFIPDWILSGRPKRPKKVFKNAPSDIYLEPIDTYESHEDKNLVFNNFKFNQELKATKVKGSNLFHRLKGKHDDCYTDPITGKKICPHEANLHHPRGDYYA